MEGPEEAEGARTGSLQFINRSTQLTVSTGSSITDGRIDRASERCHLMHTFLLLGLSVQARIIRAT